jgi:bifunctional UDP-N-acetylglucosamine pyrophosphorylase/glucosamine-1-phosphate N-acetyltransferase
MAAGEGTRMRSSLPKVLHPVCGRPMVAWPVLAAREAGAGRVAVIVSPERDLTEGLPKGTETVIQPEPDGTGGAVRAAHDLVRDSETVVVLSGDHPLITGEIVAALLETHRAAAAGATVMTVELDDPGAYGRIVRDSDGDIERIVETKRPEEVEPEVLAIREINTGTYVFDGEPLTEALDHLGNDNSAGEYYIGDVLPMLREAGRRVVAHRAGDPNVNLGVNTRVDLAAATAQARRQILERHMIGGVTVVDPESTWIDAEVEIAADATIEPGSTLRGATSVGADSIIGPHSTLIDTRVGEQARVVHSCGRTQRSARVRRPAASSRSRTRRSARAPRCRTSPTSATPRSAPTPTSGRAASPPTTTVARRTGRRSGKVRESGSTTRSWHRSGSATAHTLAPAR